MTEQSKALALHYDPDAVIRDQSSLIGQLQTQVIMRDAALREAYAEIGRLNELIPKDEEKKPSRSARPADTQSE